MRGPTTIMAPAVEHSAPPLTRRAYSTPDLVSLHSREKLASVGSPETRTPQLLLDGKTLPSLPAFDMPSFNVDFELDTSLYLSTKRPTSTINSESTLDQQPPLISSQTNAAPSVSERQRPWLTNDKPANRVHAEQPPRPATSATDSKFNGGSLGGTSDLHPRLERSHTAGGGFASFARRSWMPGSRSPSPRSRPDSPVEGNPRQTGASSKAKTKHTNTTTAIRRSETMADQTEQGKASDSPKSTSKAFARASSYFAKMKQKQTKPNGGSIGSDNSCASSATSLAQPAATSIDTRGSQSTFSDTNMTTPTTDDSSSETAPRTRDPMWSSFKTLEMEFKSFVPKQMAQKIIQIQSVLLPFLKSALSNASTKSLRPDDVDRRATILDKWWGVVLDMLDGQGQQHPVPGVDRPILLEAATLLMMRPEWRQSTSYFLPLMERSPTERVRARSWTNASDSSLSSSQAALLAESAEHNVRTMFVANLMKQMAFVVERMSLRHAPLTLVNFAGKTCAYAFFFAPGVPDILLRLWGLTPELIRRTADEFGLPRKDAGESEDIVALFPPKLSPYGWTSPRTMWDTLKHIPKMTMVVARIPWTGPWVSRWKGRDTDLLFIFCKYFHVLSNQFMPDGLPLTEKARSPAFVLVHAQLLSILDTTIHRQAAIEAAYGPPLIDSIHGADAAALAMPLPPNNLMRGMSENRCVVLLKDVLSDDTPEFSGARHTFAQAFASMMKAATCRTSRFNSAACFTLCDFLEEALMIYHDFETPECSTTYIDWNFWFDVCKRVLTSMNTMSEVRMLSFIFTIWDAVAKDPRRKESLCQDWLLTEETFNAFFNNWCPMVRAYYQRLLCWRICRDRGSANEIDTNAFLLVSSRLKKVWAHYLYLKQSAEETGRIGPSTAPMSPALGKRFMIIRQEANVPQPGLFMGFDSFARTANGDMIPGDGLSDGSLFGKSDSKKRWSLLGKVLSLTSGTGASQNQLPDGSSSRLGMEDELQSVRRETAEARARSGAPPPPPKLATSGNKSNARDSACSSPTFDEPKYFFKFILGWQQTVSPPRERILVRPRLPTPAQARVTARARSGTPPPPASIPAPMRTFSGSSEGGLINGARNAGPMSSTSGEERGRAFDSYGRASNSSSDRPSTDTGRSFSTMSDGRVGSPSGIRFDGIQGRLSEPATQPLKPGGVYAKNAVYCGRALAEWSQVVAECNNFVERRRDEGVLGLSEVEVPFLSIEGFRKPGG